MDASDELNERIALFALDVWTQLATLLEQLFVTAHLIKRLGIGVALALAAGGDAGGLWCVGVGEPDGGRAGMAGVRGVREFQCDPSGDAVRSVRPTRETLFSVVPSSEVRPSRSWMCSCIEAAMWRELAWSRGVAAAAWGLMGMAMVAALAVFGAG
ncbi:MAG: hypothetical protein R3B67_13845 [Phycisphaerales bacterium]